MTGDITASIQCVKASIPAPAVKIGGKPKVSSGSHIAAVGLRWSLARISFLPSFIMMTAPKETSLPVPEVVGMAIIGIVWLIFPTPPSFTE